MPDYVQGHCYGERLVQGKTEDGLSYPYHLSGIEEIKTKGEFKTTLKNPQFDVPNKMHFFLNYKNWKEYERDNPHP